ncbi:MAG: hypothetical protein DRH37_02975 [Deltaproteobacteria bacterium]|nr:MAG: hypothetical protein DRH37_02975 [Deltaproteobacteria bacterium]
MYEGGFGFYCPVPCPEIGSAPVEGVDCAGDTHVCCCAGQYRDYVTGYQIGTEHRKGTRIPEGRLKEHYDVVIHHAVFKANLNPASVAFAEDLPAAGRCKAARAQTYNECFE